MKFWKRDEIFSVFVSLKNKTGSKVILYFRQCKNVINNVDLFAVIDYEVWLF